MMKMIYRMFIGTIAMGAAGLVMGMTASTFKHYYYKHSDAQDRTLTGVQEVILSESTIEVEE